LAAPGNMLPPGMTLSASGSLSGTPTAAGTYVFTVQASNGITFDEKTLTLLVN